jgi:hypothetical protein
MRRPSKTLAGPTIGGESLWSRLAGLPLAVRGMRVRAPALRARLRVRAHYDAGTACGRWRRRAGTGCPGVPRRRDRVARDPALAAARGRVTLAGFCDHLGALELWPEPPEWDVALRFRTWAFESAALDLALPPGRSLAARRARAGAAAGGFVNSLGLGKVPSMKPVRRRRPWLGAVGHTSPRPSRAPASSEQRGSQDARADPNAGLGGPANQIRASRQKQGVVRPTSMSTDKATRRPRRRPGSLPYRRDPSSAGPARACSGRRAGARVKTAAWRRNRRSTVTRSSSTSLLPWTIRSSAARGPQLRNRAIAMRHMH